MSIQTFQELFRFDDWANNLVLERALSLDDQALDREFPVGCASVRATLIHLHETELYWVWQCFPEEADEPPQNESISSLRQRWLETSRRRDAFLASADESTMDRPVHYLDRNRISRSVATSDILLHVINHGMHHRPQANNMLRSMGASPLRLDYIFMKFHSPGAAVISKRFLERFFAYNDWADDRVFSVAGQLADSQLDQEFEIGLGTLRKTLVHTCDAQRWWISNWTQGPLHSFPVIDSSVSMQELKQQMVKIRADRSAVLQSMDDASLAEETRAQPRQGVIVSFPIGQTMLQLCNHGTHHRAQAVNMLRHLGAPPLPMDYLVMLRAPEMRA
jgi:uncharacterized damage-inducible protein DinB